LVSVVVKMNLELFLSLFQSLLFSLKDSQSKSFFS
jgi:hypothetical protein